MLKTRIIPCLQLRGESLVKTVKFDKYGYIGDPINTVRIFNELEVDELSFLDITASKEGREPNYKILKEIADECFMPLSYGGGVRTLEMASKVFQIGFEKIILNSHVFGNPGLITEIADIFGSQAVVVAIDVKKNFWGKYEVYAFSGTQNKKKDPVEWMKEVEKHGAGEIFLTSIDREGTWKGFDIELIKKVSEESRLPVIAHGGGGTIRDIEEVVKSGKASAVALGSMVVYQGKDLGVLVNFPDKQQLEHSLEIR
ncbi:MAG: imidazole glycerol phosphate synthase subunit HisF [Bacteroidetes bacterium]|nr:imidazole glycerol phosphate synthase subunit HisF [Bacteroidota bacterium]MBS1930865.1 imidazole glycerol phosphate synthase subunit HisF [Bacteroidota bacterium]